MSLKIGERFDFEPGKRVCFLCPFCGKKVYAGQLNKGPRGDSVLHVQPTCKTFDEAEPDEYLDAVLVKIRS